MNTAAPLSQDELMEENFLDSLNQFSIILKKRHDLQRKGSILSYGVGQTREFKDYRPYVLKDDVRSIDWRLYARLGKLFVRLFEDHQQMQVNLYLDTSASMVVPYREKWKMAAKMTLALSYLAWQSHHRVAVYGFGTHLKTLVSDVGMPEGFKRVSQALLSEVPEGPGNLYDALAQRQMAKRQRGFHIVLSDFLCSNEESLHKGLGLLRGWPGESQLVQILHPEERSGLKEGLFDLEEVETQQRFRVNAQSQHQDYQFNFQQYERRLRELAQSSGMGFHVLSATEPFEMAFRAFLTRSPSFRKAS